MYPPSITTKMTAYIYYKNSINGTVTCERAALDGVFWSDNSISVATKTGIQVPNSVYVSVPEDSSVTGRQYVCPEEWAALAAEDITGYWTADLNQLAYTRLVLGECPFEFAYSDNAGLSKQMHTFDMAYSNAKQIKDVNPQLYGTKRFHHIQIWAV